MPIYEYECTKCGARFELRRSLNGEDTETRCPKCGYVHPRRIFSLFSSSTASGSTSFTPAGPT